MGVSEPVKAMIRFGSAMVLFSTSVLEKYQVVMYNNCFWALESVNPLWKYFILSICQHLSSFIIHLPLKATLYSFHCSKPFFAMSFSWRRTFRKTDGNREPLCQWHVISYWLVYSWYKKSWFYQESEINFPQLNRQLSTLQKVWKKELLRYFLINEWEHSKDNNVQGLIQFCF